VRSRYGRSLFVAAMGSAVVSTLGANAGVRVVFAVLGVILLVACVVVEVQPSTDQARLLSVLVRAAVDEFRARA
jgi:FtsH-binding integral membrane protein